MQNYDELDILTESDNYFVWRSEEEGEYVYHLELGAVSLHLMADEWEELITLFKSVS